MQGETNGKRSDGPKRLKRTRDQVRKEPGEKEPGESGEFRIPPDYGAPSAR